MARVRWRVGIGDGEIVDVQVQADDEAPIGLIAHVLARELWPGGVSDGPLTLMAGRPGEGGSVRPPSMPLTRSGLRSGSDVWVVRAGAAPGDDAVEPADAVAWVTWTSARMGPLTYPLKLGSNAVGRGWGNRVRIPDARVSRHGEDIVLRRAGRGLEAVVHGRVLRLPARLALGPVELAVRENAVVGSEPGIRPSVSVSARERGDDLIVRHMPAPRVLPPVVDTALALPVAPAMPARSRAGFFAAAIPAALGVGAWLITGEASMLSIVAMSAVMIAGTWADQVVGARRAAKKHRSEFWVAFAGFKQKLAARQREAVAALAARMPSTGQAMELAHCAGGHLWGGQPGRQMLRLRLGTETRDDLVPLGERTENSSYPDLTAALADELPAALPTERVPVGGSLADWGNVGIAGASARDVARAAVVQLVAGQSPRALAVYGAVGQDRGADWAWLQWLPHVSRPGDVTAHAGRVRELATQLDRERMRRQVADEPHPDWPALVVVVDQPAGSPTPWLRLAETGPALGIFTIWVSDDVTQLPAECAVFVEAGPAQRFVDARTGRQTVLTALETATRSEAERTARALAPIVDLRGDKEVGTNLPAVVALPTALVADVTRADVIAARWRAPDDGLTCTIGIAGDGPLQVSLRHDGPHALVGGTTGAGKSEFLQTWIASLATSYDPAHVTFLLVDYKGGSAFAQCAHLPHVVGLVTDLSPGLVERVLVSLRAELRHREHVLADYGVPDLVTLIRDHPDAGLAPLVIVIDEFAALVADVPEFVDGVVDIAQRGRSLGLHLILATQRPAGVIRDNVRANTAIRIALRMADDDDSLDVVAVRDAARFFAELPGRALIRRGAASCVEFQSAFLGTTKRAGGDVQIDRLGFARDGDAGTGAGALVGAGVDAHAVRAAQAGAGVDAHAGAGSGALTGVSGRVGAGEVEGVRGRAFGQTRRQAGRPAARRSDLQRICAAIAKAAHDLPRPRRPWLDPLPAVLTRDAAMGASPDGHVEVQGRGRPITLGLIDDPNNQRQVPLTWDPGSGPNLLIVGPPGSGKTQAGITALVGLAERNLAPDGPPPGHGGKTGRGGDEGDDPAGRGDPAGGRTVGGEQEVVSPGAGTECHVLDLAGSLPAGIAELPGVVNVVTGSDEDRLRRLLRHLASVCDEKEASRHGHKPIILVIDGFGLLLESVENDLDGVVDAQLATILRAGELGVRVIATATRISGIPARLIQQFGTDIRLSRDDDISPAHVEIPGRGHYQGLACQVAITGATGADGSAVIDALVARGKTHGIPSTGRVIASLPDVVTWSDLHERIAGGLRTNSASGDSVRGDRDEWTGSVAVGVELENVDPWFLDLRGITILSGPPGSGVTTALRTIVSAAVATAPTARIMLMSPAPEPELAAQIPWDHVAVDAAQCADVARAVTESRHLPDLLVIAGIAGFAETECDGLLAALIRLVPSAVVVVEPGLGARAWQLHGELAAASRAIALQPGDSDPQLPMPVTIPRLRGSQPGRGILADHNTCTPVQFALPPA